eukprot:gene2156-2193_t
MRRRTFVASGAAVSAQLARPFVASAQAFSKLSYIPVTDLTVLDPFYAGPDVTSLHASNVFETLYAMDRTLTPQRQMAEGEVVEDDGRRWTITLRPGLRFHDGERVLASDVVASLRKWGTIDVLGAKLMSVTDSLTAVSDRVVEFRLRRPFPLMKTALSKPGTFTAFIMPSRLVPLSGTGRLGEIVGSGPYVYRADERVIGSRVVYTRFDAYVPRQEPGNWHAGGRIAHFPRVVWTVIPDAATAAAAMQKGEADWWGDLPPDLAGLMRTDRRLQVQVQDLLGGDMVMRFNALYPPFDNPAVRSAILPAIDQSEFMTAINGDDRSLWRDRVGVFSVGKPMSTDAGVDVEAGDLDKARRLLAATGATSTPIVMMVAADYPSLYAAGLVSVDLLRRLGFKVEVMTLDYGTYTQRRASKAAPGQGGWNVFINSFSGYSRLDPAAHLGLSSAWAGWPKIDEIEALRDRWFEAADLAGQRAIAREIQMLVWRDAPFVPLGTTYGLTAFDRRLTGIERSHAPFFNVKMG